VRTDGIRLTQILINLISNAIKYTVKGEVYVEAEIDKERKQLRVAIRDTGVGMSKEQ
jgi:two-component system, sensor histidine kinase and response regulator